MQHAFTPDYSSNQGQASFNTMNIDNSLMSLSTSWPNLVGDLTFDNGVLNISADTKKLPPMVHPDGNWVQLVGKGNRGSFCVYMPSTLCANLLEASNDSLDISRLEGSDAALILEYLFDSKIGTLEELFNDKFSFIKLADVSVQVNSELFGIDVEVNGEVFTCALSFDQGLRDTFEVVCSKFAMPLEKNVDRKMIVHLGPVIVPARQAYLARKGEAINCGVMPSEVIRGVLMRSDGRYWPIHIEDEEVQIVGELAGPVTPPAEKSDDIYVTFGLGEVRIDAYTRANLVVGDRLNVIRLPNNNANVYYQARPFGQGHLSILGPNLAVTLERIGTFKE